MKSSALQSIVEIECRPRDQRGALWIDDDPHRFELAHDIVVGDLRVKEHVIAVARTATRANGDAKRQLFGTILTRQKLGNLRYGRVRKSYGTWAAANLYWRCGDTHERALLRSVSELNATKLAIAHMSLTLLIMTSAREQGKPASDGDLADDLGGLAGATPHEMITEALRGVIDPELGENIVDLGMVRSIRIEGGLATIEVALTVAGCPMRGQIEQETTRAALRVPGIDTVSIEMAAMEAPERSALMARARRLAQEHPTATDIPSDARIIGVISGKGGVGKSSITANLGAAMAASGVTVGLLDADIWGFSIPRMLGVTGPLEVRDKKILPLERKIGEGLLKVVSMGFLSDEDEAIMWRGLVLNRALQHFIEDVAWGDLDYLLVDLPPGTGDVQMGLARMLPRTELLIVTTPGLGAQKVAGRAADMARKGNLRIAGVIENMSGFTCSHGEFYRLFGEGGGRRLSDAIGVPLVAQIPIDPSVASGGDIGEPAAVNPDSPLAAVFAELAHSVITEIAPVLDMHSCSARLLDQFTKVSG